MKEILELFGTILFAVIFIAPAMAIMWGLIEFGGIKDNVGALFLALAIWGVLLSLIPVGVGLVNLRNGGN